MKYSTKEMLLDWSMCYVFPGVMNYYFGKDGAYYFLACTAVYALTRIGNNLR